MRDGAFDRIAVVGTSCSGKTTLARELSGRLGARHVELDALHWGPNWTPTPSEQLRPRVEQALAVPNWVCDGNYRSIQPLILDRATAIVWLNYSFPLVLTRAVRRTVRRVVTQERLYADNRESFKVAFMSRDSMLVWVATTHRRRKSEYRRLFASTEYPHLRRIELTHPRQTRAFAARITQHHQGDVAYGPDTQT